MSIQLQLLQAGDGKLVLRGEFPSSPRRHPSSLEVGLLVALAQDYLFDPEAEAMSMPVTIDGQRQNDPQSSGIVWLEFPDRLGNFARTFWKVFVPGYQGALEAQMGCKVIVIDEGVVTGGMHLPTCRAA